MMELRQSTAITLKIGPALDEDDGKTAETGLTITQAEVRLSKNGGNMAQKNEATSCTHDELGVYGCPIDTTDTNTLGRLQLWVHESGALPIFHEYMVVTQNYWDSKYSTDELQVEVVTATDLHADLDDGGRLDLLIDAIKAVTDALPDAGALNDLATILTDTNELQTDWTDGGRLDLLIDAISATAIADAILKRGVANVEATADVDSLAALILSKLHAGISGLVLTIYRTDDTTVFDTKDVVKDAAADPITSVADP